MDSRLDFSDVGSYYFRRIPDNTQQYYDIVFHKALKPLSTLGVDNVPDLMQFLPPPSAKNFPAQALGLVLLLDQMPRALLSSTNVRYPFGYFDVLAQRLVKQFAALPPEQRPDTMARLMSQGWSFERAIVSRIWFFAPYIHSESMEDQEHQLMLAEEMRRDVEKHAGVADPNRATADEDARDAFAFPRLVRIGPPRGPGTQVQDFAFWILRIFDLHTPIIRKYRRYPERNARLGRISTADEEHWLEVTGYGDTDDEAAKQIREDVAAGRWTPLQNEEEYEA